MDGLSPLIAFTGGLVSLLSPCILPVVPVYIASLSGPAELHNGAVRRQWTVFLRSLSFIAGFSLVFILLGAGAGLIGFTINPHSSLIRWLSGGFLVLFGLFMLAMPHVPWLNYEKRFHLSAGLTAGYLRSFLIGLFFALAWTPCVGPVLGGILTLALNSSSAWQGAFLLAVYSLGVALPFLACGLAFNTMWPRLKRVSRWSAWIQQLSGLLLIAVGGLILSGKLNWFSI